MTREVSASRFTGLTAFVVAVVCVLVLASLVGPAAAQPRVSVFTGEVTESSDTVPVVFSEPVQDRTIEVYNPETEQRIASEDITQLTDVYGVTVDPSKIQAGDRLEIRLYESTAGTTQTDSTQVVVSNRDWRQGHNDAFNTGVEGGSGPVDSLAVFDEYNFAGGIYGEPVVKDDLAFVPTSDTTNAIVAINATTREVEWRSEAGGDVRVSPAVDQMEDLVVVGDQSGTVTAINVADGSTAWSVDAPDPVGSAPTIADGSVYVGYKIISPDVTLGVRALTLADGTIEWESSVPTDDVLTKPAYDSTNGTVYVGSVDTNVYALNTADGNEAWSVTTGGQVTGALTFQNGAVYVPTQAGEVYALNPAGGGTLRTTYTDSGVYAESVAADANENLYVVDGLSWNLRVLDAAGSDITQSMADGASTLFNDEPNAPAVRTAYNEDPTVYTTTAAGEVTACKAAGGVLDPCGTATMPAPVESSPVPVRNAVLVGDTNGNLYVFGEPGPAPVTVDSIQQTDSSAGAQSDYTIDFSTPGVVPNAQYLRFDFTYATDNGLDLGSVDTNSVTVNEQDGTNIENGVSTLDVTGNGNADTLQVDIDPSNGELNSNKSPYTVEMPGVTNPDSGVYPMTIRVLEDESGSPGNQIIFNRSSFTVGAPPTLGGTVRDWQGNPVSSGTVNLYTNQGDTSGTPDLSTEITSTDEGTYQFDSIPTGEHTLEVTNVPDHKPATASVSASDGDDLTHDFGLAAQPGSLSGYVSNSYENRLNDVTVNLYEGHNAPLSGTPWSVTTGSINGNGFYEFGSVAAGDYTLEVTDPDHLDQLDDQVSIGANEDIQQDEFYLTPIGTTQNLAASVGTSELQVDDTTEMTVTAFFTESSGDATLDAVLSSSDTDVVTVDDSGTVEAVGGGEATLTAEFDGFNATVDVSVSSGSSIGGGGGGEEEEDGGDELESEDEPVVNVSPDSVAFGDVRVGDEAVQTVTIENNGGAPLDVSNVSLAGDDAFDSQARLLSSIRVASGDSERIEVTAEPDSEGDLAGALTLETNDEDVRVDLSARGVAPDPRLVTEDVDFGVVAEGSSPVEDIVVRNNGTAPLNVTDVRLESGDDAYFTVDADPFTVDPDTSGSVPVRFTVDEETPTDRVLETTLVVETGDESLQGPVRGEAREALVDVEPDTVAFGQRQVGTEATENVTVSTALTDDVEITGVELGGQDAGQFAVESGSFTVGPNETQLVETTYAPVRGGDHEGTLRVLGSEGEVQGTVDLNGTALAPEMTVTPDSVAFDGIEVGETTTETVTIENTGEAPLTVSTVTLAGGAAFELGTDAVASDDNGTTGNESGALSLDPGETHDVSVTFAPETEGTQTGILRIRGDDPSNPSRTVFLSTGNVEADIEEDGNETRAQFQITDTEPGEQVNVNIPDSSEDGFATNNVSLTPESDEDITLNVTSSRETLETTPQEREGMQNGTKQLGNMSIETNLDGENISEVSMRTELSREDIDELDSDPGNVSLYRYDEATSTWEEKETRVVETTDESVVLQGRGEDFSEWTAAAKSPVLDVTETDIDVEAATTEEEVLIQVLVTNSGGTAGSYEAVLFQNEQEVDRQERTVPADGTVGINFARTFDQPGLYQLEVNEVFVGEVNISQAERDVEVDEVEDPDIPEQVGEANETADGTDGDGDGTAADDTAEDESDGTGAFGPGFGVVTVLLAVLGLVVAVRLR